MSERAPSLVMGRPAKVVQQTFAVEGAKVADSLNGFRRVKTLLCDHMPALREGDILELRQPKDFLMGPARVLEFRHIEVRGGTKTAVAILLKRPDTHDEEVEGNG